MDRVRGFLKAPLQHIHHRKVICRVTELFRAVKTYRHAEFLGDVGLRTSVETQECPRPDPVETKCQVPRNTTTTIAIVEGLGELRPHLFSIRISKLNARFKHFPKRIDMVRVTTNLEWKKPGTQIVQ